MQGGKEVGDAHAAHPALAGAAELHADAARGGIGSVDYDSRFPRGPAALPAVAAVYAGFVVGDRGQRTRGQNGPGDTETDHVGARADVRQANALAQRIDSADLVDDFPVVRGTAPSARATTGPTLLLACRETACYKANMQETETHRIDTKVIAGEKDGPHLLISGGVHGDEYESMAAVRRLMKEISPESLTGRVTLAPVFNEPAFENYARTGPDGLDLARVFTGNPEGSISERVAHAGTQLIESVDYFIDLHTGGLAMKIFPMSGYILHANPSVLDTQRRMSRAFNLPVIWGTYPGLDGRSLSVARDANIPAIYGEWGGGGGCNPVGVEDYVTGCLNVMAELEMLTKELPESRVEHVVEDNRPNAGYMQINYNAQSSGYFEPAAKLGDMIRIGDVIGTIISTLGEVVESVPSTQTGLLLTLRALPRVEKGDCLAVIIEMEV